MLSLTYVSTATKLMSESELAQILDASRRNNFDQGVTGMLLYEGGNFMQVLEGPENSVLRLTEKIRTDPRHTGVLPLLIQNIDERQFANWSMAFQDLDALSLAERAGVSDFLTNHLTAAEFRAQPHRAYKLLLTFRDRIR